MTFSLIPDFSKRRNVKFPEGFPAESEAQSVCGLISRHKRSWRLEGKEADRSDIYTQTDDDLIREKDRKIISSWILKSNSSFPKKMQGKPQICTNAHHLIGYGFYSDSRIAGNCIVDASDNKKVFLVAMLLYWVILSRSLKHAVFLVIHYIIKDIKEKVREKATI